MISCEQTVHCDGRSLCLTYNTICALTLIVFFIKCAFIFSAQPEHILWIWLFLLNAIRAKYKVLYVAISTLCCCWSAGFDLHQHSSFMQRSLGVEPQMSKVTVTLISTRRRVFKTLTKLNKATSLLWTCDNSHSNIIGDHWLPLT